MTREEAIANLEMISVAFVEPVTKEQRKMIDDTFELAIKELSQEPKTDVLDSIRSEIVTLVDTDPLDDYRLGYNFGLMRVAQIIDRYKGDIS